MCTATTSWITGCSRAPGRPAPPILEVSGAGLPYYHVEPFLTFISAAVSAVAARA